MNRTTAMRGRKTNRRRINEWRTGIQKKKRIQQRKKGKCDGETRKVERKSRLPLYDDHNNKVLKLHVDKDYKPHTYRRIGKMTHTIIWRHATAPYVRPKWHYTTPCETSIHQQEWSKARINYRPFDDITRLRHACPRYHVSQSWLWRRNAIASTIRPRWRWTNNDCNPTASSRFLKGRRSGTLRVTPEATFCH